MKSIIAIEHDLLGARYDQEAGYVAGYAGEPARASELTSVSDLSGALYLLASGGDAGAFAQALCAGKPLAVGECAYQAVLTGDGALVSVPLLIRTGDSECVLVDISPRFEVLLGWLQFLTGSMEGQFGELGLEDASAMLVPFAMRGPEAALVLKDYLGAEQELPLAGQCASIMLDAIPCVVAHLPSVHDEAYVILVPPNKAQVLWRSFLSFTQLQPIGVTGLARVLMQDLPWGETLMEGDRIMVDKERLMSWGLARAEGGFIGSRALVT